MGYGHFGLSDPEHLADAAPDDRLTARVDGPLVGGRAGSEVLAVCAVELGLLGGDDERLDVVVGAKVVASVRSVAALARPVAVRARGPIARSGWWLEQDKDAGIVNVVGDRVRPVQADQPVTRRR
jgi:hypothetical protein